MTISANFKSTHGFIGLQEENLMLFTKFVTLVYKKNISAKKAVKHSDLTAFSCKKNNYLSGIGGTGGFKAGEDCT